MRALLLVTALLLPAAAGAGPSLSLRLGYASSFGSAAEELPMSQVVDAQIPFQLDAVWRFGGSAADGYRGIAIGPYASWALGLAGGCDVAAHCSASSMRVGLQVIWTFRPLSAAFDSWLGAGAGWEWTRRRRTRAEGSVEWQYQGAEMLSLQGGADFVRRGRIAVGPFLLLELGRYSNLALDTPVESSAEEIGNKRLHAWLQIGVRAKLDL